MTARQLPVTISRAAAKMRAYRKRKRRGNQLVSTCFERLRDRSGARAGLSAKFAFQALAEIRVEMPIDGRWRVLRLAPGPPKSRRRGNVRAL